MKYVGNTVRNMHIQDFSMSTYVGVYVGVISWVGVDVSHAVSVASVWTNSAVIVAELHPRVTAEATLKQHSQTSAMKCICVCFK